MPKQNVWLLWSDSDRASSLICGNKMPTRCNRWYLLQILLLAQHVSVIIMLIIRSSRVLYRWSLPVVFGALVFKLSVWCGADGYVSSLQAAALKQQPANLQTLEVLMMGMMVPETCWASNKVCNIYHLLHLVGILFPHSMITCLSPAFRRLDDGRSPVKDKTQYILVDADKGFLK